MNDSYGGEEDFGTSKLVVSDNHTSSSIIKKEKCLTHRSRLRTESETFGRQNNQRQKSGYGVRRYQLNAWKNWTEEYEINHRGVAPTSKTRGPYKGGAVVTIKIIHFTFVWSGSEVI